MGPGRLVVQLWVPSARAQPVSWFECRSELSMCCILHLLWGPCRSHSTQIVIQWSPYTIRCKPPSKTRTSVLVYCMHFCTYLSLLGGYHTIRLSPSLLQTRPSYLCTASSNLGPLQTAHKSFTVRRRHARICVLPALHCNCRVLHAL